MISRQATGVLVFAGLAWLLLRQRSSQVSGVDEGPDTVIVPSAVIIGNKPIVTDAPFNGSTHDETSYTGVASGDTCRHVECFRAPCPCISVTPGDYGNISQETVPVWHLL